MGRVPVLRKCNHAANKNITIRPMHFLHLFFTFIFHLFNFFPTTSADDDHYIKYASMLCNWQNVSNKTLKQHYTYLSNLVHLHDFCFRVTFMVLILTYKSMWNYFWHGTAWTIFITFLSFLFCWLFLCVVFI